MSATLTHKGLPENIGRSKLIEILETARNAPELLRSAFNPEFDPSAKAARLSDTAMRVFRYLVDKACRSTDFLPGRICGCWEQAASYPGAAIALDKIKGDVLLICGGQDMIWPSCPMAQKAKEKLEAARPRSATLLAYPDAGNWAFGPMKGL